MAETDLIWSIAQNDLLLRREDGGTDAVILDHSVRVARTALQFAGLAELDSRRIDRTALYAAALYHDAGWVVEYADDPKDTSYLLAEPTSDVQRELGAGLLEEKLVGQISRASVSTAAGAIRRCNLKEPDQIEAVLLAEAENLDEIGPLFIGRILRRYAGDSRGLSAVIGAWQRQQEYRFWQARIKDCFRLPIARQLAEARLAQLEPFMDALATSHRGDDVTEAIEEFDASPTPIPTT